MHQEIKCFFLDNNNSNLAKRKAFCLVKFKPRKSESLSATVTEYKKFDYAGLRPSAATATSLRSPMRWLTA
nr:hypothetical protein [Bifidobacterium bifidum]